MKSEIRNLKSETENCDQLVDVRASRVGQSAPGETGLTGKRVVVTRARHQATSMAELLARYGAEPLFYPCIAITPPEDTTPLDEVLQAAAAGHFDWLLITSANTALALSQRLAALSLSLDKLMVAAVGPKTAVAVGELLRIDVHLVAHTFVAQALVEALQPVDCQRILLPQSEIARPVLANELRAEGAQVTVVDAYRTVKGQGGDDVPSELASGTIDAVTFTSSSTVLYFLQRLGEEGGHCEDLKGICLAAIGPVTAETLREAALPVTVMPDEYTVPGLIKAMASHFAVDNDLIEEPR